MIGNERTEKNKKNINNSEEEIVIMEDWVQIK